VSGLRKTLLQATRRAGRSAAMLALAIPVLLAGCTAHRRTYRELVRDFEETSLPRYGRQEITAAPASASRPGQADRFLAEAERTVLKLKQEWEAALAASSPAPRPLAALTPADGEAYRRLAAAPDLDERLAGPVDLELLLGLAWARNPGLAAARKSLQATLEQYPQAAYLDNILQQYNAFAKQLDAKVGPARHKKMMKASFPFPDALALKGRIVSEEVEIAVRAEAIVLRDLATDLKAAYYDWLFVQEAVTVNRENQTLLEEMIKVAQAKVRADRANYESLIMAQVELSKLVDALITLEERRETLVSRINTLLDRAPDAPLGSPAPVDDVEPAIPLEQIYKSAIEQRQELQAQRLRISKMKTVAQLAARMAHPDASAGASYFEDRMKLSSGSDESGPPPFSTRPGAAPRQAAWFGRRDAYLRELTIRIEALERALAAQENETRRLVKEKHFGVRTAKRSVALHRHALLPQTEQAVQTASAGYQNGKTDFLTFLDTQRTWLKFRLEERRAVRDLRVHLVRLEQLAGGAIPRKQLDLTPERAEQQ